MTDDHAQRIAYALGHIDDQFAAAKAAALESLNALLAEQQPAEITDVIGFTPFEDGEYHLRGGFGFMRDGDEVVITDHYGVTHQVRVPVNEWASVLAFTSLEGDTGEKWREALDFLGSPEPEGARSGGEA